MSSAAPPKRRFVSESLAMELIGHDSVSVDRSYVHTSPDAMRNALNALPALS